MKAEKKETTRQNQSTLYRVGNFCMLLNFIALVVTGAMRFTQPFNIAVTRVHMLCGFAITLLISLHIIGRLRQLRRMVKTKNGFHYVPLLLSVVLCGVYWSAAWYAWPGAKQMVGLSYESRHKKEIFRAHENIVSSDKNSSVHAFKLASENVSLDIELDWSQLGIDANTDVAIWAETKSGSMIETFFLSNDLNYSEKLSHRSGKPTRGDLLPVWRNRYTAISGIDPDGNLDAISGPTKNHKFDLNSNLNKRETFSVFVEVNAADDKQPSIIYAAMIDPESTNPYTLLSLLGTGKDAKISGAINYDLSELTTSKHLIDKILVHTIWGKE